MSAPATLNGINAVALSNVKTKMRGDPNLGKAAPVAIKAAFDPETGVVTSVSPPGLTSAPMPHTAMDSFDATLPTPLSYCPLFAGGCYSLVFMLSAAQKSMQFDAYTTKTTAKANMSMFYDEGSANKAPWTAVDIDISVQGPQSQEDLNDLAKFAHDHCPSTELLERSFAVKTSVKGTITEGETVEPLETGCLNGYNLAKYKSHAAEVVKDSSIADTVQDATGTWYCKNECETHPGALMHHIPRGATGMPISMDVPIGNGKYPNPVVYCFFGATSFYMHTFAVRLSLRNVTIKSLNGQLNTKMNKRKMMAVQEDARVFEGGTLEIEVESTASEELLEEVRKEADSMCPAIFGLTQSISMAYKITKV